MGAWANWARTLSTTAGQLGVLDALPDQAPIRGLLRRELVAEQREAHRARRSDETRQEVRAARVRNEADLRERLDEARRFGSDDEIARQRDVGPRARRHAVDDADDRQRQRTQAQDERLVVAFDRGAEVHRRLTGRDGAIREILAGAEAAARPGQQQCAHRRVVLDAQERVANLGMHRVVEAVEAIGAIERQPRDPAVDREQDIFVAHGWFAPFRSAMRHYASSSPLPSRGGGAAGFACGRMNHPKGQQGSRAGA